MEGIEKLQIELCRWVNPRLPSAQPMAQPHADTDADRFVEKWSNAELSERAASHEHFIDLCHLIGQPTPASADSTGDEYTFEKPVKVVGVASKGSKG